MSLSSAPILKKAELLRSRIPLRDPVMLGLTRITFRDYVSLKLSYEDGSEGFATGFERGMPLFDIAATIAHHYLGRSADLRFQSLNAALGPAPASRPVLMRGISLFDVASWDAYAKQLKRPLWSILGGARDQLPLMPVIGYGATPKLVATQASDLAGRGFKYVKLMIGGNDLSSDIELMKALRTSLPDDCSFGIDAHWSWRTASEALPTCIAAQEIGASFIEDPFAPSQWRSLAILQENLQTPIAVGEDVIDRYGFRDLAESAPFLRPDATASGGVTALLDVVSLANTYDRSIIPHVFPYLHSHFGFSSLTVKMVESILPEVGADPIDQFLLDFLEIKNGHLLASNQPGANTTLAWEKLSKLSTRNETFQ